MVIDDCREDFTEDSYRNLLRLAKQNYSFVHYSQFREQGKLILWRHDIDLSAHRAYRLAQIEAQEGIVATYFIHLHNMFYNFLELEVTNLIGKIIELGHDIGLHFDPAFYGLTVEQQSNLSKYLRMESFILEEILNKRIHAFSLHNPDIGNWMNLQDVEIEGLINTYSSYFQQNYAYCSDSNGYWRFKRMEDVLKSAEYPKLQVLTHPGWWTPEVMSPRDRISRCIDGRAARQHRLYDELLIKVGRENIR